jgi:type I restriction enzyme S subunit
MKPVSKHSESWPLIPFARIIEESAFGPRFSGDYYDLNGNVATLRTTDLQDDGRISYETMPFARLNNDQFQKHYLKAGDLVITRSGTCGIAAVFEGFTSPVVPGAFLIRFRLTKEAIPKFYAYYFNSPQGRANVLSIAAGAVQQNLNSTNLANLLVPRPSVAIQRTVARILSTYDDLIENNLRRIKILEQMAQMIYREWFVNFRFPGHEKLPLVGSIVGDIPQCWEIANLSSICVERNGVQTGPFGSQLHMADYSDEGVPVVMPKDLIGLRIRTDEIARIPESIAEKLSRHRMQPDDIVYGRRGDIGRRAYLMPVQTGWFCGTGCLRIRPNSQAVNSWYLFNYLGQDDVQGIIRGRALGVTMPNLNTGVMASVPVKLPPRDLQEAFARLTFPMAEAREVLTAVIENLRRTRDLLLPKFVSGEVSVEQIESEAAAQTV